MKGVISQDLRAIMREPEAREKLMRILSKEAEDNVIVMPEGTRYEIDNYNKDYSRFYKKSGKV